MPRKEAHRKSVSLTCCHTILHAYRDAEKRETPFTKIISLYALFRMCDNISLAHYMRIVNKRKTTPEGVVLEKSHLKPRVSSLSTRRKPLLRLFIGGVGKYIITQEN